MREIKMLVVHCTDSPDHMDQIGVTEVRNWHTQKGWSDIGYHWLVNKQAKVEQGRPEQNYVLEGDLYGAHARGHNKSSIGIVWVGRDDCHADQFLALVIKCAEIVEKYDIPLENVLGHCELPGVAKTCPNLNMTQVRNAVQQITGRMF